MSVDFFLTRFRQRTNDELEIIVRTSDGTYSPEAVEAAVQILAERKNAGVVLTTSSPGAEILEKKNTEKSKHIHPFNPLPYLKSFGLNDLLTLLSVGMFLQAIAQLSRYYNYEPDLRLTKIIILVSLLVFSILLTHILYKKDHKKANNYLGRCIQDTFLFMAMSIYISLYDAIANQGGYYPYFEDGESLLAFVIGMFFISLIFEGLVSLFKFVFRFLKWQIL